MIDLEDPIQGTETTSPHHPSNAGAFKPAGKKDAPKNTIQKGTIRGEMIPREAPRDIEKDTLRIRLLGRVEAILKTAEADKKTMANRAVDVETYDTIIAKLQSKIKTLEQPGEYDEELKKSIDVVDDELSEIRTAVWDDTISQRAESIEQQDAHERLNYLIDTQETYGLLKMDIAQIQASNSQNISNRDEILHIAQELSWLNNFQKIKEYAKNKSLLDVQSTQQIVLDLGGKVEAAKKILDKETEKDLIAKAKAHTVEFERLLGEAYALIDADDSLKSPLKEREQYAKAAENSFNSSLTVVAFLAYTKAIEEYKKIIEESKKSSRTKISVPHFMSRTLPVASIDVEPAHKVDVPTTEATEEATPEDATLGDIEIPNLVVDESTNHREHKYKVNIEGKLIPVPSIFINTLKRFVSVLQNQKYKDRDFTEAVARKNKIMDAISIAKFNFANENAMALGKELDSIEGKGVSVTKTQKNKPAKQAHPEILPDEPQEETPDSVPDAQAEAKTRITRKAHDIVPTTISQDKNTNHWKKEKGGKWVNMEQMEIDLWIPIHDVLEDYKLFMSSKDVASANSSLVAIKNEILDAVDSGNFVLASEKTKSFKEEFNRALQVHEEVRRFNLKKLQEPVSKVLTDETLSFAFIKTPQETPSREYRIISRSTGDWVPLTSEDLVSVELSNGVLANFKIRNSTPTGSVEKKNEVIRLINDYDFKGAKKAAEEYMNDFAAAAMKPETAEPTSSSPLKKQALRPTTPVTAPSPENEKANLLKSIAIQEEQVSATGVVLEKMIPLLTTDLEKKAFIRLHEELKSLVTTTSENPTKESLELLKAKNERLLYEISKKRKFFDAQFGPHWMRESVMPSPDATVIRSSPLRRSDEGATTTVMEYAEQQKNAASTADIKETKNQKKDLLERHQEMFKNDPELYKEIYAHKNTVRDQLTEDVSTIALANQDALTTKTKEEFAEELASINPRDYIKNLVAEKHVLMQRLIELQKQEKSLSPMEDKNEKKAIDERVTIIDQEVKKYTDVILQKFSGAPIVQKNTSLLSRKEVYSPAVAHDDPTRAIGENFEFNAEYEPVKIDRTTLGENRIKELGKTEVQLSGSIYPNHSTGMVASLNEHEAKGVANTYKDREQEYTRAPSTITPLTEKQMMEEQAKVATSAPPETPEQKVNKMKAGEVLMSRLTKWIKPVTSQQWFRFGLPIGLATVGAFAVATASFEKKGKGGIEDVRLIDEIQNQPGWRKFIAEDVPKEFLEDFTGPHKLTFENFMIKNAPSFKINPSNPSALKKLEDLVCQKVYFVVGADAGITEQQQKESSDIVNNLKETMIAAKAYVNKLYPNKDIEGGAIFGNLTIRQFYEEVSRAVAEAEADKARIQAIKK